MKKQWKERNVQVLQDTLKKKGFRDAVLQEVRDRVMEGKDYSLSVPFATTIDGYPVRGTLTLRNSGTVSGYQIHSLGLELDKDSGAILQAYEFRVASGYDVSLREAYNLMHGRYVYKEGAWVTVGIKGGHPFATRLDNECHRLRVVKELKAMTLGLYLTKVEQKVLAASLREGNRQELVLLVVGFPKKVWVMANPVEGRIQVTDEKGDFNQLRRPCRKLTFGVAKAGRPRRKIG